VLHIRSPKGLSPTGVGPVIFVGQLVLLAAAIAATQLWPSFTSVPSSLALRVIGGVWLAVGLVMWGLTLRVFLEKFPRGELIVDGTYRFSRNPLYASLIVFVVPAVGLMAASWPILLAAILGAALAYPLIRREERDLERTFGTAWRDYRARTSWLFPLPPRPEPANHRRTLAPR